MPLNFRLSDLSGNPVSLTTEAFLNANNCLKTNKIRIRIKELKCIQADDGGKSEQIYGGIAISLHDHKGKPQNISDNFLKTIAILTYAKENSPIHLISGTPVTENDPALKDKHFTLTIENLDYRLFIVPTMNEADDFGDDKFITGNGFDFTIRNMLLEGESVKTFEFRHDASQVHLTIGIELI